MKTAILIVGPQGSGKSHFCREMVKKYNGIKFLNIPEIVYELFKQSINIKKHTRIEFNKWTTEIFKKGYDAGVKLLFENDFFITDESIVLIDGIHNPEEVDFINTIFDKVLLILFWANKETRYQRVMQRKISKNEKLYSAPRNSNDLELREINDIKYFHQSSKNIRCLLFDCDLIFDNSSSDNKELEDFLDKVYEKLSR